MNDGTPHKPSLIRKIQYATVIHAYRSATWCNTQSARSFLVKIAVENNISRQRNCVRCNTFAEKILKTLDKFVCSKIEVGCNKASILTHCMRSSFSKWRYFHPIRWIRWIGQNHPSTNRVYLQPHAGTKTFYCNG